MTVFSKNLKRFRVAKNLTQEQAAEALGVSTQTVSRWECDTTLPDVTILPEIAKLYCVTIDDLFKETSVPYDNYAQRLGSIYEATRKMDDFLQADMEYRKLLKDGAATTEDLRLYGILCQYMMEDCRDKALSLFERILNLGIETDEATFWRTKRQKLYLLSQIGRADEAIAAEEKEVEKSTHVEELICLIAAYQNANRYQDAKALMEKALTEYPENPALLVYCGNVYGGLKQYDDAFRCWEKALQVDSTYLDAQYAMGFCYEQMGDYEKAYDVWCSLCSVLADRGFDIEKALPEAQAAKCKEKISS